MPSNGRGGSKTAAQCEKHIIISDLFHIGSHGYFSCMCMQITNLLGIVFSVNSICFLIMLSRSERLIYMNKQNSNYVCFL